MTHQLQTISNELHRINSYTGVMAKLAADGHKTQLDMGQLQKILDDVAKVTGWAYAEMETIINRDEYKDPFDKE